MNELEAFHDQLCETRVLDPACGTGNFLYVTLEHLKRLEGEVFSTYESFGERQMLLESGHTVDPHQFLGIEINPRAAAIADLVLWIGYLQWHFRTRGNVSPPEPIIKNFNNIECRDAVLAWTSREPLLDDDGKPVTRWDGRTTKKHPVTGEEVPDETAREISYKYINPKKAEWPKADYVVGNPPFIGNKRMRFALGDGYVDALRAAHPNAPASVDFVMYWWNYAAELARNGAMLAVSALSGLGTPTWTIAVFAVAAAGACAALVRHERRAAAPLLDLRAMAGTLGTGPALAGALCAYLVLFGPLVLFPQLVSAGGGGAGRPACCSLRLPVGFGVAAVAADRLLPARWPNRRRCLFGGALAAV